MIVVGRIIDFGKQKNTYVIYGLALSVKFEKSDSKTRD